eukprot:TRINITY_DN4932_c0_g2_i10.p1 TRINITY_DN4932_c0_g2~~TRINITY_DN4932_c0_g2_i10.p1  ORF type:complete len:126 (+),score=8.92 TRINITY_DN4932_c0_g2_i10:165-542(+)
MGQNIRNTVNFACTVFFLIVGVILLLLGGGPDSPNASGRWGLEWNLANCTIIESRIQTLPSATRRAIFRVNVSAKNSIVSPVYGATAVQGSYGWGGYSDDRKENSDEKLARELASRNWGAIYPCW